MEKIQQLVAVCIVLHNLLIGWADDDWELSDDDEMSVASELDIENELNKSVPDRDTSDTRRKQFFEYFKEHIY